MKTNKLIMLFGVLVALTSCSSTSTNSKTNYSKSSSYNYNYYSNSKFSSSSSSKSTKKLYTYTDSTKTSLYFGSYPQTLVTSSSMIKSLNSKAGTLPTESNSYNWTNYVYKTYDCSLEGMFFIDIDYDNDGAYDYRGVHILSYRKTVYNESYDGQCQLNNGYNLNHTYWFRYDPIEWKILKTSNNSALILSDLILDSQPYYEYTTTRGCGNSLDVDYQGNITDSATITYPNNYKFSEIRNWLNMGSGSLYNKAMMRNNFGAFNEKEYEIIKETKVDNSSSSTWINYGSSINPYACEDTNDKIFLLSYKEMNTYFDSDTSRLAQGTEYAKSQGLSVMDEYEGSPYLQRSPYAYIYNSSDDSCVVNNDGSLKKCTVNFTCNGVRPACWINL